MISSFTSSSSSPHLSVFCLQLIARRASAAELESLFIGESADGANVDSSDSKNQRNELQRRLRRKNKERRIQNMKETSLKGEEMTWSQDHDAENLESESFEIDLLNLGK